MMNSTLLAVLTGVALVVVFLIIKKVTAKKQQPREEVAPEVPETPQRTAQEEEEQEKKPVEPESAVEAEEVPVAEEASKPVAEVTGKGGKPPEEVVTPREEPEEEVAEEEEPVREPEPEEEEVAAEEVAAEPPKATLTVESYEHRLFELKDKQMAALTEAIEAGEEGRREQLQVELVAITEALTFVDNGYAQEMTCRNEALLALEQMASTPEPPDYQRAVAGLQNGHTEEAEQIFRQVAAGSGSLSALAAYHSGRLAECRVALNRAIESYGQAVSLEEKNPLYLRAAALLARKLYQHKEALSWLTTLVEVGEERGEDSVELALDRRELAYTAALVGRHKQAGELYKKAMTSLIKLLGKEDPELGVCWFQIGKLQEALGQYEKAEDPYNKALAIMGGAGEPMILGEILEKLAALYMELERENEAIPLFERLAFLKDQSANPDKASLAMTSNDLAEAYRICGRYEEAEIKYKRSLALTEELRGKEHAAVGSVLQELAQLCQRQGKTEDAARYQERAGAIFEKVLEEQEAASGQSVDLKLSD